VQTRPRQPCVSVRTATAPGAGSPAAALCRASHDSSRALHASPSSPPRLGCMAHEAGRGVRDFIYVATQRCAAALLCSRPSHGRPRSYAQWRPAQTPARGGGSIAAKPNPNPQICNTKQHAAQPSAGARRTHDRRARGLAQPHSARTAARA
jgi:hypothetical protein